MIFPEANFDFSLDTEVRLGSLSELIKSILETGEWNNKALDAMFTEIADQQTEMARTLQERIVSAVRVASGTSVNDSLEAVTWFREITLSAERYIILERLIQSLRSDVEALGYRFSTTRLSEETDVHMWWNDDIFNENAESNIRKFLANIVFSINSILSSRALYEGLHSSQNKLLH